MSLLETARNRLGADVAAGRAPAHWMISPDAWGIIMMEIAALGHDLRPVQPRGTGERTLFGYPVQLGGDRARIDVELIMEDLP